MRERQQESEIISNWPQRLRAARQSLGLSQGELGNRWDLTGNYVWMFEKGEKPIPSKYHSQIAELEAEVRKKFESPAFQETPLSPAMGAQERAPVVSWASAGRGGAYCDLAEFLDEFVETDCKDPNKYALIVEGDSMRPEFQPGDRIVVAPNFQAQNGDEVVARLAESGKVLFKIYHERGNKILLTSYNQAFPPLEFKRSEFRFVHPVYQMMRRRRKK